MAPLKNKPKNICFPPPGLRIGLNLASPPSVHVKTESQGGSRLCCLLLRIKQTTRHQTYFDRFFSTFIFLKTNKNNRLNKIYSRHMQSLCTLTTSYTFCTAVNEKNANTMRDVWVEVEGGGAVGERAEEVR